jgi:uncharacterized protein (TIGR03067 family)
MLRLLAVTAVTLVGLASIAADDKKAEELKALKGDWKAAKVTMAGADAMATLKDLELTILDDNKYKSKLGTETDEGTFTFDPAADPKSIDIKPNAGQVKLLKAIYKIDGDSLVVCYDIQGKTTPPKFESTAENKFLLVEYKRKK